MVDTDSSGKSEATVIVDTVGSVKFDLHDLLTDTDTDDESDSQKPSTHESITDVDDVEQTLVQWLIWNQW